jgi:hypothetical protein
MAESQELATGETTESHELTPEEIEEFKELTREESDDDPADRPSENPSVRRCIRAWNLAFNKAMAEDDDTDAAELEAKSAYLRTMPPLAGFENVRDFIACICYAQIAELIQNYEAVNLLASAKVALAAVRQEGRLHPSVKRPGRPPKPLPEEEIK